VTNKDGVSFTAGGQRYVLGFSAESVARLEDELGMTMFQIGKRMEDPTTFRMSMLRTVFWAGLLDKQEDMDVEAARRVFAQLKVQEAVTLVAKAMTSSFAADL
jgi:hypothetical protein